jgi:hypothetical protein
MASRNGTASYSFGVELFPSNHSAVSFTMQFYYLGARSTSRMAKFELPKEGLFRGSYYASFIFFNDSFYENI